MRQASHPLPVQETNRPTLQLLVRVLVLSALYATLAWGSFLVSRGGEQIAAVWFPNAVVLAILLHFRGKNGQYYLAGIFCANVGANLLWGDGWLVATGLGIANLFEITAVLWALRKVGRPQPNFHDNHDTLVFVGIAIAVCAVSGCLAVLTISPAGFDAWLQLWWTWTRSDALGLLLLVPAIALLRQGWCDRHKLTRRKCAEAAVVMAIGTSISVYTFWQSSYPFLFLDAPIVLFYAIRLGPLGCAIAIVNLAIVASVATALGHGPIHLVQGTMGEKLMVLQLFLASSFAIGLPVAAMLVRQRELMAAKAQFLASMSHDIRTPMNGVIGFAQMLRETDLTEQQRQYLDNIDISGTTMMALLNDILDLARIDAGRMQLVCAPVNLRAEIAACLAMVESSALRKGLTMSSRIAPDVPQQIMADSLRLRQVIMNLLGNAVKFTNQGSVSIEVSQTSGSRGDQLLVSIRDTGIGIAPQDLQHIFNAFAQVLHPSSRRSEGSGLGLAISSELLSLMGARVDVQSTLGEGSVFTIALPLERAADLARPAGNAAVLPATDVRALA